jgi:hypothetical protein
MTATKTTKIKAPAAKAKKAKTEPRKPENIPPANNGAATKAKRVRALDAAATVLGEVGRPMNCKELIEAMAAKGDLDAARRQDLAPYALRRYTPQDHHQEPTPARLIAFRRVHVFWYTALDRVAGRFNTGGVTAGRYRGRTYHRYRPAGLIERVGAKHVHIERESLSSFH